MSEVENAFIPYMQDQTGFPATFLDNVVNLLKAVNYTVSETDHWLLAFTVKAAEAEIRNACNTQAVPEGLYPYAVRLTVAEFLMAKKGMGQSLQGLNLEPFIKQIQEGDTSITFEKGMQPEERFDKLLQWWLKSARQQYVTFRRLVW